MRPVFIGGALRSGTTMLADLVGCHPDISPIYETDFVISLLEMLFVQGREATTPDRIRATMQTFLERVPGMGTKKRPYERYVHGNSHIQLDPAVVALQTERLIRELEREPLAAFGRFLDGLFRHHASNDGKPHWVNKTPGSVHFAPGIRAVLPGVLIVHVIRDGRDVAASTVEMSFGPRTIRDAARWWVTAIELGEEFGRAYPDQYLAIRYEDLARDAGAALGVLMDRLDMDVPETLLSDWAGKTGGADPSRIGAWEDVFTTRDRNDFTSIAGPALERHGYEVPLPV